VSVEKEVDEHGLDLGCIIADLVVRDGSARPNSSRLSVDLPANGAQSARLASSFPPSTAITGS